MEEQKTLEELKAEAMLRYGITQEQVDNLCAAYCKLWEAVRETIEKVAAAFYEIAEQIDAGALAEAIERLQGVVASIYISSPPTYNRADTRNAQYNARLKGYKNKYIRSAAIRAPKRSARSCC